MASVFTLELDDGKVYEAIQEGEGTPTVLGEFVTSVSAKANALSSAYRTGRFYDRSENRLKGDTQPRYAGNVEKHGKSQVGLVWTANYAAQKENHEHNTLLKSIN